MTIKAGSKRGGTNIVSEVDEGDEIVEGKVRGLVEIRDASVIVERELVGEVSREERRCQSTVGIMLIGQHFLYGTDTGYQVLGQ